MTRIALGSAGLAATVGMGLLIAQTGSAEAGTPLVPEAALVAEPSGAREVAVLAGGCFWGVEAVFEHVKGVTDVRSGYAGGEPALASYGKVSSGRTGHAEAVRIVFNPRIVRYDQLLQIFFAVAHDPTQLNRQGPDVGPQYRSAIFPQSAGQRQVAAAYVAQITRARTFKSPIATRLESGGFFEAEQHHQDFMARNPAHPYIVIHDRPKLAALKRQFPAAWKG